MISVLSVSFRLLATGVKSPAATRAFIAHCAQADRAYPVRHQIACE